MELSRKELNNISGGGVIKAKMYVFGGMITFIIGILDGFLRPLKCN